jgi:hypothetical protein
MLFSGSPTHNFAGTGYPKSLGGGLWKMKIEIISTELKLKLKLSDRR